MQCEKRKSRGSDDHPRVQGKVGALLEGDLRKFAQEFGGDGSSIDYYVREFVHHPEQERRLCQLLDLETEEEKATRAALESAEASRLSAKAAMDSALWAKVAGVIAGLALVVSIVALVRS